jgi:hypothetical protein
MPRLNVRADVIEIALSPAERLGALHGSVSIPRAAVRAAEVVEDGLRAAHGLRAPGLALPGRVKLGTWRARGDKQFVAVRRGVPALQLRLAGQPYDTVLVSTPEAADLQRQLQP